MHGFPLHRFRAGDGGALFLLRAQEDGLCDVELTSCLLANNSARAGSGGGVSAWDAVQLQVSRNSITQISAAGPPHAPNAQCVARELSHTRAARIRRIDAQVVDSEILSNTAAASGGAFAVGLGVSLQITGSNVSQNTGSGGGALSAAAGATATVASSNATGNRALLNGGFARLSGGSSLALVASNVSGNSAGGSGGVLYLSVDSSADATDCTVADNQAALGGGVAFVEGAARVPAFLAGIPLPASPPPRAAAVTPAAHDKEEDEAKETEPPTKRELAETGGEAAPGLPASPSSSSTRLARNTAGSWGAAFATDGYKMQVEASASVAAGAPLDASLAIFDGYGQLVLSLPDSLVTVSCALPVLPSRRTVNTYAAGQPLAGVSLTGNLSQTYLLQFDVAAAAVPAGVLSAAANVTIGPCGDTEVFDELKLTCVCAAGAFLNASTGLCDDCEAGFISQAGARGCLPCPVSTYAGESGAECLPCPAGSSSPTASPSFFSCACPYDFLSVYEYAPGDEEPEGIECEKCEEGALCDPNVYPRPLALEGFWHAIGARTVGGVSNKEKQHPRAWARPMCLLPAR